MPRRLSQVKKTVNKTPGLRKRSEKVRVVVVDDSAFARSVIVEMLSTDPDIEVVGEASDGEEALEKIAAFRPDLVTMDIHMPVMNGLTAIERIMAAHALPILVVTSASDSETAFAAVSRGALEVMAKPECVSDASSDIGSGDIGSGASELVRKIKMLSKIPVISHIRAQPSAPVGAPEMPPMRSESSLDHQLIAVAASTGGPKALAILLSAMPGDFPTPIVVAQHMAEHFTEGLAAWLDRLTPLRVKIAEAGETPKGGVVYMAPSERHLTINRRRAFQFRDRKPGDLYFPSCDALMISAADAFGRSCIGVILTGMGADGVLGIQRIKAVGGVTIAQDETSSVVFGMPKVAIESGCIDRIVPIQKLYSALVESLETRVVIDAGARHGLESGPGKRGER